jgi:hypothetical protein
MQWQVLWNANSMYRSSLFLTTVLIGINIVHVSRVAAAKSLDEIETLAKAVTVEIKLKRNGGVGSGVIVARKGDLYTLVTNRHVICGTSNCKKISEDEVYSIKLHDGQKYLVQKKAIQLLGNDLDLAMVQFRSGRNYKFAKVAPPGILRTGDKVYTSGYPFSISKFSLYSGETLAVVNRRLTNDNGGYTIIYDSATEPGMSGGGVFDSNGQLIAVHGQGDRFLRNTEPNNVSLMGSKIGFNRGIPIRWLVKELSARGVKIESFQFMSSEQTPMSANTADEYFISGYNKYIDPGVNVAVGKKEAIKELTKAISLNPRYIIAYSVRSYAYQQFREYQSALADFNTIISLTPEDSSVYIERGMLYWKRLKDLKSALSDFDQAIKIDIETGSRLFHIHCNKRGKLKYELNDFRGALADFNSWIAYSSDPQQTFNFMYYNTFGMNFDFSKSPKYHHDLGIMKYLRLNDQSGGIADVRKSLELADEIRDSVMRSEFVSKVKRDLKLMGVNE